MSEPKVNIKINGNSYAVPGDITIMKACKLNGIDIPALCYLEGVNEQAACSICVVEVSHARTLLRSCVTKVMEGMEIFTNTERVRRARRVNLELILANHPKDCLSCERNQNCELQRIADRLGVDGSRYQKTRKKDFPVDSTSPSIVRDPNKCILCGRCVQVCDKIQSVKAIDFSGRGQGSIVTTFFDRGLGKSSCVNCGQCTVVCPTGALVERSTIEEVWAALHDPEKTVIVQTAPAIRAAIGEEFGFAPGVGTTGKLAAALRCMGFDRVFDTQFAADLTIIEEGTELLNRVKNKGVLPLITSCSPGWIKFGETFFPRILDHISSCKSPQQMFGAVAKTYYAGKNGIDPRKMVVVSIMPCTAKKFEALRPEINSAAGFWRSKAGPGKDENYSFPDVDYVLTTREAAKMIKEAGIRYVDLPDSDFDHPLGISTGAAAIFGASGGVMEAALRSAYFYLTGEELEPLDFYPVRGLKGIKQASIKIAGTEIKVCVAHGLANAREIVEEVRAGKSPYHFIEIMACPGGCIGGGGQPIPTNDSIREKRIRALYAEDKKMSLRRSHHNPAVKELYSLFLKQPNSRIAHELLHTKYLSREELLT